MSLTFAQRVAGLHISLDFVGNQNTMHVHDDKQLTV